MPATFLSPPSGEGLGWGSEAKPRVIGGVEPPIPTLSLGEERDQAVAVTCLAVDLRIGSHFQRARLRQAHSNGP